MSAEVINAKRIMRTMETLEPKMRKKLLRKAMRQAAKNVMVELRPMLPVDTGRLRKSLKVRALPRSRVRFGYRVFSDVPYAKVVEYGDRSRGPNGSWRRVARRKIDTTLVQRELKALLKEL